MTCTTDRIRRCGRRAGGFTLIEMMIGVAVSMIVLAMAAGVYLFGSTSLASLANYEDLDARSRSALDQMTRDIRQASQVTAFQTNGTSTSFTVTNATQGVAVTYVWNPAAQTLVCQKTGHPDQIYLTGCANWSFEFFQRTPYTNGSYVFFPATNSSGAYDLSICKLINMTWKCSRRVVGSKVNTECVKTAQVVLRNKQ